jgi:siroheme synthase-like protein
MERILMSPVAISPGNRKVTVFGGGRVALRKCQHFEGFHIKVVAGEIMPELEALADETVHENVDPATAAGFMDGADIVVAATADHELNNAIRDISMSKGILTNSAHGGGDLLIPSVLRREGYTVTVSSEGRVPAFPPYVVKMLDGFLDESYDRMLELLMMVRPEIRDKVSPQPKRAEFLARILDDQEIWGVLRTEGVDPAFHLAMRKGGLE